MEVTELHITEQRLVTLAYACLGLIMAKRLNNRLMEAEVGFSLAYGKMLEAVEACPQCEPKAN